MKTCYVVYGTDKDNIPYFFNKEGGTSSAFDTIESVSFDNIIDAQNWLIEKYKDAKEHFYNGHFYGVFRVYTHVEDHDI